MKSKLLVIGVLVLATHAGLAQEYAKAKVSFSDFQELVAEVETHRASRLVDLNTFLKMSQEPGVIVLDARSAFRFERIHLKGAKHLAFTDFTQDNLQKAIPSFETTVLIYCNNNFEGNQVDFASKVAFPLPTRGDTIAALSEAKEKNSASKPRPKSIPGAATQFAAQKKPVMLALNIPTYINLYGYGYRNVYELDELVNVRDSRIAFEGSTVNPGPAVAVSPVAK